MRLIWELLAISILPMIQPSSPIRGLRSNSKDKDGPGTSSTTTRSTSTTESTTTTQARNCNDPETVCLKDGNPGQEEYSGNVLFGGLPICDDSWDLADANVVCRELGYIKAKMATTESHFANLSSNNYAMDNVRCTGDEKRLKDCSHSSSHDCSRYEGAGVICDTRSYSDFAKETCYEIDFSYTFGDSIDQNGTIANADECQKYCQEHDSCTHFTYYPESKRCYRKTGNSKVFKNGAISGPRNCSAVEDSQDDCYDHGRGYNFGDYLDYFITNSVEQCQKKCQEYTGCIVFTFYTNNNECYMKTGKQYVEDNRQVISGPKYCDGQSTATSSPSDSAADKLCGKPGQVCLKGGNVDGEGNVYFENKPVCDDSWDLKDALVVCRQLGFHGALAAKLGSFFGSVSPNFALDNVDCLGTEDGLKDCPASKQDDCGADEGAGVKCDTRPKEVIQAEQNITRICFEEGVSYEYGYYVDYDVSDNPIGCQKHCQAHPECTHFTYYHDTNRCYRKTGNSKTTVSGAVSGPRNCSDVAYTPPTGSTTPGSCGSGSTLCLVGGNSSSEGNLMLGNKYICDDEWDLIDGNVACRELGFVGALRITKESYFGTGKSDFAMDDVRCRGSEERLMDCLYDPYDDCGVGELAGVVCETRNKDEVAKADTSCFTANVSYSPGDWIDNDVVPTAHDCQIHCLAHSECMFFTFYVDSHNCYRKSGSTRPASKVGAISGPRVCPSNSSAGGANGSSNAAAASTTPRPRDCSIAGVVCLTGGKSESEGNVMVGGLPVCDDSWGKVDARVACRELGYIDVRNVYVESHFKGSDGDTASDFSMDEVECEGTETSLALCRHSNSHDCTATEIAGVRCETRSVQTVPAACYETPSTLCLVGGRSEHEGNVYVGGGPICHDDWSHVSGYVVCKQLGFAGLETITKESAFGLVRGNFSMTNVLCSGKEDDIQDCSHKSESLCSISEGAGVICIGSSESRSKGGSSGRTAMTVLVCLVIVGAILGVVYWKMGARIKHIINRELMVRLSGNAGSLIPQRM